MEVGQVVAIKDGPSVSKFPLPTFHRVIIEPMDEEYAGRLFIPETVKDKPSQGRIIAVGPGRRSSEGVRIPMEFSPGQIVVFNRFSGTDIKVNHQVPDFDDAATLRTQPKTYVIVAEDDIIAVLN